MLTTMLWVGGGLVVFLALFQRRNLRRLVSAVGGQVSKVVKWLWGMDPIAVYQAEVDRSAEEIQHAGEGLEQYRGLVSRLQRQVANGESEVARLTQKVKLYLTEKQEDKAAEYAVQLKKVQNDLAENKAQLSQYESAYQNNLKKVKYANERIRVAKEKAQKMQAELRLSKAEAETARLAQSFNVKSASLDSLGEIEEEIQRQIDNNRARGQVITDLSQDGLLEMEEQDKLEKAEARQMLENFKQEMETK